MGTPDSVKRLVDRFDQNHDATDGSQLTAYSLRPSNSGPSAVSRKPMADLHGQVYEQFLGKVIKLTDGHRAKVEEKPEVRKAGGVHYTPQYIVNYIVKNTVGNTRRGGVVSLVERRACVPQTLHHRGNRKGSAWLRKRWCAQRAEV